MKESMSLALLTAGSITHSPVSRFPEIVKLIGPVKAPTYREASRAVNALKGGLAVRSVADIPAATLFLVCAPRRRVPTLVRDMVDAVADWRGRDVVLCSDSLDSRDLDMLARRGAHTASVLPLDWFDKPHFLVEGDPRAVQRTRKMLESTRGRVLEIETRGTPFYTAAADLASLILLPLLEAATASLRDAGIPHPLAHKMVDRMVARSLRNFGKSGSKTWRPPTAHTTHARLDRQLEDARGLDNRLSDYYRDSLDAAVRYLAASREPLKRAANA